MRRRADRREAATAVKNAVAKAAMFRIPSAEARRIVRDVARALISDREMEYLHEQADGLESSNRYPKGTPDHKQPTGWHEGRALQKLVQRLAVLRASP